jgi:prepilin-type N-terminal cleavage/methylation domain-containing protein
MLTADAEVQVEVHAVSRPLGSFPPGDKLEIVRDSRGFTLVELLIVITILGVLLSLAVANYRHARIRGSETAAIAALTSINQAQYAFSATCGRNYYAPHLTSLGKPNPGTQAPYLSPDLTQADEVTKSGYIIRMSGTEVTEPIQTCTGETPVSSFQTTADPATPGVTGQRFFGSNRDLVVYESVETLDGKMPEFGPPDSGQEARGAILK